MFITMCKLTSLPFADMVLGIVMENFPLASVWTMYSVTPLETPIEKPARLRIYGISLGNGESYTKCLNVPETVIVEAIFTETLSDRQLFNSLDSSTKLVLSANILKE